MKVVAIIQARMGSSRLPGKVLRELAGQSMLQRVVGRVAAARTVDEIVVATTWVSADEAIADLARRRGWLLGRGSERDVLDRFYQIAASRAADAVVRITADCPVIDPAVIDQVVSTYLAESDTVDYASCGLPPRTFPRGLDTEAFSFDVLRTAWRECQAPGWREHVTPFVWNQPERFRLRAVTNDEDWSSCRWTVDTPQDLEFMRAVYAQFGDTSFGWRDVLEFLHDHPEAARLNAHVRQKTVNRLDDAA